MPQIFYFMLKVILCSGILFGYYHLFLLNKVYHAYNRFYLLCAVIISLTVPLFQFDIYNSKDETQLQPIQMLEVLNNSDAYIEEVITTGHTQNLELSDLLLVGYVAVAFVFLLSFVILLIRVFSLINKSEKNSLDNIILINSTAKGTPFSFFRYLFWNSQIDINTETGRHIFSHELAHIREKHSLDKIFLNVVLIICWINPFFWLIRKELNIIHEFIADKIHGLIHCSGGGQTKCLKYLPENFRIVKDNLFTPPPVFQLIKESSGSNNKEMYEVFNMGCRMEIYCAPGDAQTMIDAATKFNIDAQIIGRVEASDKKELVIKLPNEEIIY